MIAPLGPESFHYAVRKGWTRASRGDILLLASNCKHFSNRSTRWRSCFSSSSFIFSWTLEGGRILERRSRVALEMTSVLATS